ncbi:MULTISPECIES: hypothetical protein [Chryseobacterium]|uniref:Uncharacterized protein n=1 Tax=Chryseobacterium pennae TaxID=2258962 RepID=A0A3D9C1T9_9FLAO|nr:MULTISPECIES: hypothetical protein [Chryseobacterium]MCS4304720.1 hypothetical protein [Chryseobacterium sp. BIGb0232]REC59719.1 hypothetical protein DRF65_24505 [Chryseobacterium pennae]ROS20623.1 hypothetical protein EDF65_1353 [Chryseobacterium nakagawai]
MIKEVVFRALNWRWYFTSLISLFIGVFCWLLILILPISSFTWNFFTAIPFLVVVVSFLLGISRMFKKDEFKNGLWQCFLSIIILSILGILFGLYPPKSPYKPYNNDIKNPKNAKFSMPLKIFSDEKELVEVTQPDILIYDYLQPGTYKYDVFLNKTEKGKVYLKVYDFNTNRILSEKEIKKESMRVVFNPNDELKEFSSGNDGFTVKEGDWGDYYGSRIEVWFKPDNSNESERKLVEKNYIIQGN